jgi:hypothetical protein
MSTLNYEIIAKNVSLPTYKNWCQSYSGIFLKLQDRIITIHLQNNETEAYSYVDIIINVELFQILSFTLHYDNSVHKRFSFINIDDVVSECIKRLMYLTNYY